MNNYQLNNTSVYIGGQCKWDIVVDRVADGKLEVSEFQLTPLSSIVPFNKKSKARLVNTDHSTALKRFVANVREDFWNTKPDIVNHTGIDVTCLRGPRRLKQYDVYKKQFGYLQPMWLEFIHKDSYLKFTFYVYVEGGENGRTMIDSSTLSLGQGEGSFHNQFVQYLNNWLKYTNITPDENSIMQGNDKVMDFSIEDRSATICGINVNTGQRSGEISVDYTIANLLSQERPLMEADYIVSTLFKNHNIIATQLFNFNFCFNITDLIDPTLFNMVYGKKVSVDCVVDVVNGFGGSSRISQMSMYSNYEYIPRDYAAPYFQVFECVPDDDEVLYAPPGYDPYPPVKWSSEEDANVLSYLQDYDDKYLKKKNKLSQPIIHWGYSPDNVKMFNFYEGFEGAYIEANGYNGSVTSSWSWKPFFVKSTNGVSMLNFPYAYAEGNNGLTWLEPKDALFFKYKSWNGTTMGANKQPYTTSYYKKVVFGLEGELEYEYASININQPGITPNKEYIITHSVPMDYVPREGVNENSPDYIAVNHLTYAGYLQDINDRLYQYGNKFALTLQDVADYWGNTDEAEIDDNAKLLFLYFQPYQPNAAHARDTFWNPLYLVNDYLPLKDDNNRIRPIYTYYQEVRAYGYFVQTTTPTEPVIELTNMDAIHEYNPVTYHKYVRYNGTYYYDDDFNDDKYGYIPGPAYSWETPVHMDSVPDPFPYVDYTNQPRVIEVDGVTYRIGKIESNCPDYPIYFYHPFNDPTPDQKAQMQEVYTLPYERTGQMSDSASKYGLHLQDPEKFPEYLEINQIRQKITGGLIDKSGFDNTFVIAVSGWGYDIDPIIHLQDIMGYVDKDSRLYGFLDSIRKIISKYNSGRYIKFDKELAIGVDDDGQQCYYRSNIKRSFPFRSSGKIRPFITADPKYVNYTYTNDLSTGSIVRVKEKDPNWDEYLFEKENFYYVLLDSIETEWEDNKVETEDEIIAKIKSFVGEKYGITDTQAINYIYSLYYKHYFCDLDNIDEDQNITYKYSCKLILI